MTEAARQNMAGRFSFRTSQMMARRLPLPMTQKSSQYLANDGRNFQYE